MKIWIFNQYADSPDRQTTAHFDLGVQLVSRGHSVTVFAAGFNHYKRREERLIRGGLFTTESYEGVRFVWLRTYPYQGNDWRRALNMLSYAWQSALASSKIAEKPDAVIGTCPQTLGALVACWVAAKSRTPFFFEVRDLWPETLVDSGGLSRKSPLFWLLSWIEKVLFRRSKAILSVLPNIIGYIGRLGIPEERVVYIPNGTDLSRFKDLKPLMPTRSNFFTVMYLGGLARYNGVDVLLEAAKCLERIGRGDIRFVIFGDGPEKEQLMERSRESSLQHVEFRSPVPKQDLWKVMGEADAFIYHVRNLPVLRYGISSNKLCDYLASGRPVIFAANSSNNPVAEAQAGISIPPEDPQAMADAIARLHALPFHERFRMGENGVEYVRRNLDVCILAQRLESALFDCGVRGDPAMGDRVHGNGGNSLSNSLGPNAAAGTTVHMVKGQE
jgi:glycosyltransferase involved in cell wall biosynthesis